MKKVSQTSSQPLRSRNVYLLLLLVQLLLISFAQSEKVMIFDKLTDLPCDLHSSDPPPYLYGESVFSQAKLMSQTVQEIMVTMLVYPLDMSFNTVTLFSVYQESPLELIASLTYNRVGAVVMATLKNSPTKQIPLLAPQTWIIIHILVRLVPSSGIPTHIMDFYAQSFETSFAYQRITAPFSSGTASTFDRSNLLFNFGYSSPLLPDLPSCSRVYNVVIEFNFASTEWNQLANLDRQASLRTTLLTHYDFFYSKKNPKTIMSFQPYLERIYNADITASGAISSKQILQFKPYSISEKQGLILYFEVRALPTSEYLNILTVKRDGQWIYKIEQQNPGKFVLIDPSKSTPMVTLPSQEWIQIVVILQNEILSTGSLTFVGITGNPVFNWESWTGKNSYATFEFGGTASVQELSIDNIRIYSGSYWKETSTCLMQVDGDTQDCLLCKPTYLLSYQQHMTCVPSGSSTMKQNIEDWPRTNCPLNMMHSKFDGTCYCPYQFYRSGTSCIRCPTFCHGCTSSTQCIEQDVNRDASTGKCLNNLFDDGYNCIKRTFSIPERKNLLRKLTDCFRYPFTNSELKLAGNDAFQFTMKLVVNSNLALITFLLGYVDDQGVRLFNINLVSNSINNNNYDICFYHLTATNLACFPIPYIANSIIYFGMWIGTTEVISIVEALGTLRYKVSQIAALSAYVDPSICLGDCGLFYSTSAQQFHSGPIPYVNSFEFTFVYTKFIRKMTSPLDFMDEFSRIMRDTSKQYLNYKFQTAFNTFPATVANTASDPTFVSEGLKIYYRSPFSAIKGLSTNGIQYGKLQSTSLVIDNGIGLSMQFVIQSIPSEFTFYSYSIANYEFAYSFLPQLSRNEAAIRIEYKEESLTTKYCAFSIGKPSFLAILPRLSQQRPATFNFLIEFEIVCNLFREKLLFSGLKPQDEEVADQTLVGSSNSQDIFISQLNVFSNSEVYFDYTEADGCFMYINFSDMICLKTKSGLALYQGKLRPPDDCILISDGITKWTFNEYTGECIPTDIAYACKKIVGLDEFTCTECEDPNADPHDSCKCFEGFFLDVFNKNTCTQCLGKCSTCENFEECLTCKGTGTTGANCVCLYQSQYIVASYDCEDCSPQCERCELSSDNCLECSTGRINVPNCECNPQYFSSNHSSAVKCVPYDCSYKCDSCEYSENSCVECGPNRSNPPACDCDQNYFEINQVCTRCAPHQYYNKSQSKCLPCSYRCIECADTAFQCTECDGSLYLYKSDCLCSDLSQFIISDSGEIFCSDGMDVTVSVKSKAGAIYLVFTFEFDLDPLNFSEIEFDQVFFLYFNSIHQDAYNIKSGSIEGNQLLLEISFKVSFYSQEGSVMFLTTAYFTSAANKRILDHSYLSTALKFHVGSFVLKDGLYSPSEVGTSVLGFLQDSGEGMSWIEIIKQLQIAYYIINTLQPSTILLLVNTLLPPNIYQLLQVSGALVFPKVGEQQKSNETNKKFYFFQESLPYGKDISSNSSEFLARFGISDSLIVTMPITFIQFLLFSLLSIVIGFLVTPKGVKLLPLASTSKLESAHAFINKRTTACIEGGLLILVLLSTNQFENIHSEEFFNRVSQYIAVVTLLGMNFVFLRICPIHKSQNGKKTEEQVELTQKLKKSTQLSMNYLNFQLFKKIFMALVTILAIETPRIVSLLQSTILLCSLIFTIKFRPYAFFMGNVAKIIGESCQLVIWVIYLGVFTPFESQVHEEESVSDEDVNQFLFAGSICIYAFLTFNAIYVLEFVFNSINNILESRKKNKLNLANTQFSLVTDRNQVQYYRYQVERLSKNNKPIHTLTFPTLK